MNKDAYYLTGYRAGLAGQSVATGYDLGPKMFKFFMIGWHEGHAEGILTGFRQEPSRLMLRPTGQLYRPWPFWHRAEAEDYAREASLSVATPAVIVYANWSTGFSCQVPTPDAETLGAPVAMFRNGHQLTKC